MKYFKLLVVPLLALFINACKTDLDMVAPYKESVAVYCLLNQYDSVNYVRVNRVFLGEQDATQIAAIKDSVYFKPGEASVSIDKYWVNNTNTNNVIYKFIQTIVCTESYEKPLNAGVFNTQQLIYRTNHKFKADSANKMFEYRLTVRNNKSGKVYTARTTLIKDIVTSTACANIPLSCFLNTPNVSIVSSNISAAYTKVKFGAPVNAQICSFAMRFFYTDSLYSGTKEHHYVDMDFGFKKASALDGSDIMDFSFVGDDFYKTLRKEIPDNPNVESRKADSINFFIIGGGTELSLYNEINGTSGAFGQEKPAYSNITDGYGVFSARYTKKINKAYYNCSIGNPSGNPQSNIITSNSLLALATCPHTCMLRFKYCGNSLNYVTNTACQ